MGEELGRIEVVDPRKIWASEEHDFTPWLAKNIETLSDAIGFPISIEGREHRVGAFELDLIGRVSGTDRIVAIENQLEPSDHRHLGQLVTYAAGLKASVVIWITPSPRDEHREAIQWLNSLSGDRASFFLVRPEVIQVDDSRPAVRFQVEVAPSDFLEELREVLEDDGEPRHQFRRKFWSELLTYLADHGHSWARGRRPTRESWISSSVGRSGISVNLSMAQYSRLRVEVYLAHTSHEQNTLWFETLQERKAEVETLLGDQDVSWEPLNDAISCRIAVYRPYDRKKAIEDAEYRASLYPWLAEQTKVMRRIAKEYIVDRVC